MTLDSKQVISSMAACGSLQHIFDTILPENPTLIESLSWNQIKPVNSLEQPSSLTEIFGELHFKESSISSSIETNHTKLNQNEDYTNQTSSSSSSSVSSTPTSNHTRNRHKSSDSFSSLSSESLQLCTEGLGFESSDDVEDLKSGCCWQSDHHQSEEEGVKKHVVASEEDSYRECRRSRVSGRGYPPPISCIGRSGKPCVCFKSVRSNGRFVLKEIRIPSQEFLHAYREDGRLKLHFVQPEDEFIEEDEDYDDDDDDDDDDDGEEEEEEGFIEEEEENTGKENENDCCERDMYMKKNR